MANTIRNAQMCGKIYRDTLVLDERSLAEKASDDAVMSVRGKINDLLTVKDSHAFVAAMTDAENGWAVINNAKYHTLALMVAAIDKVSPAGGITHFRATKAIMAVRTAGWNVRLDEHNVSVVSVEWIG